MKQIAPNSMIQNRYLVVQMIGKGGMGEVYLAVDQRLGSAVALKRTMFKENPELGAAFEREAKILGRLRHPVLTKVIDHFIEGNDQYLVMEHISGDDVGKRLESAAKPFPLSWVMFWADQLLDALNYLHSHEPPIIHRDIKPENLKLTDDNHIVLLDFGLSKDFDTKSESASLGTGSVVGYSPYFASMEQVRGTGTDARSDIYSLSATLYQLLTNTIPADSLTRADAMLGGLPDPVKPLSELNPEVNKAISDVVLKGMAVRQDNRFDRAADMQKELRRAFNRVGGAEKPSDVDGATTMLISDEATTKVITEAPAKEAPTLSGQETEHIPVISVATTDIVEEMNAEETIPIGDPIGEVSVGEGFKQSDIQTQVFEAPVIEAAPEHEIEVETVVNAPRPPVEAPVAMAASAGATAASIASPQQKKKSKSGLLVGGLVGILLLAAIAAGGGWYAYNNYYLPSQVKSTPTPAATASPSPTESVVVESNSNSNANAEVTQTNTNTGTNTNKVVLTTPTDTKPDTPTASKTPPPAQTTKPPTVKATPKPKGRDDRTTIVQ
ncbi:MAG: serine/threonine protein kinase [Chloracidobacterium sp.]|nr:serine/threonine protein kinase [Chloracidobacterium sp.]